MELGREIRRRAPHVIWPAFGLLAIVYFAYHAVHGERGILAWRHLDQKVETAREDLAEARAERETLERRVRLLHPESLDADMLEESARRVLGYGRPDDLIILTPRQPKPGTSGE